MRELSSRLAGPVLRLVGRDERGAVGVFVAVLIAAGVLLGIGALVLDAGQLFQDRAQLQNGADAAALAVAQSCASGTCTQSAAGPVAAGLATGNSPELAGASVDLICGSGGLGTCPAITGGAGSLTGCPPNPANGANYVDVYTSTKMPGGSTLLPPVLARTLLGFGSYNGTSVGACAQAEWGPAQSGMALTIAQCAWVQMTGDSDFDATSKGDLDGDADDALYKTGPNYPIPLYLKGKAKTCADPGAGLNLPGGFDWLNTDNDSDNENTADSDNDGDASSSCTAYIDLATKTTYNNTGANISSACQQVLQNDVASYLAGNPVTVFLPVFDTYTKNGRYAQYHIVGLVGFVITGYMNVHPLADAGKNSACGVSGSVSGNNAPCIEGYFTPGIDPVGPIPPPPPGGGGPWAMAVVLTG